MHLSVHPHIRPSICLSAHPSIHAPTHPSTCLSIHPSTHPSMHSSIHSLIYLPDHPSVHPCIFPSTHPSIYLTIHPSRHPSSCLVHPSIYTSTPRPCAHAPQTRHPAAGWGAGLSRVGALGPGGGHWGEGWGALRRPARTPRSVSASSSNSSEPRSDMAPQPRHRRHGDHPRKVGREAVRTASGVAKATRAPPRALPGGGWGSRCCPGS